MAEATAGPASGAPASAHADGAEELVRRVLNLDRDDVLSFCKVGDDDFRRANVDGDAPPQPVVVETLDACCATLTGFVPEVGAEGEATTGAGNEDGSHMAPPIPEDATGSRDGERTGSVPAAAETRVVPVGDGGVIRPPVDSPGTRGSLEKLETFAVGLLPSVQHHAARARADQYRVVGDRIDDVWQLLSSILQGMTDYRVKQTTQSERLEARIAALEAQVEGYVHAISADARGGIPRAHVPSTIRPASADPVAVATDHVLERERWMHYTRATNKEEIAGVKEVVVEQRAVAARLLEAGGQLEGLVADVLGTRSVVGSLAAAAQRLHAEAQPQAATAADLLAAHVETTEALQARAASDHAALSGLAGRAAAIITADQGRYREWYDACEARVVTLREKAEKVQRDIDEIPRSFEREHERMTARLEKLKADKQALYQRAIDSIKGLLDDFDVRIKDTEVEMCDLSQKRDRVMQDLSLMQERAERELATARREMEAEAASRVAAISRTRSCIDGLTAVIDTRCEKLEALHRNTKYNIHLAAFLKRFVCGCVTAIRQEQASAAKQERVRLTRVHMLVMQATQGVLLAHARDVFIKHAVLSNWGAARGAVDVSGAFCHEVADPLEDMYASHTEMMDGEVTTASAATTAFRDATAARLAAADASLTFLMDNRVRFVHPVEAVAAAVAVWERAAAADIADTTAVPPPSPLTATLLPWTTRHHQQQRGRRPRPPLTTKAHAGTPSRVSTARADGHGT